MPTDPTKHLHLLPSSLPLQTQVLVRHELPDGREDGGSDGDAALYQPTTAIAEGEGISYERTTTANMISCLKASE